MSVVVVGVVAAGSNPVIVAGNKVDLLPKDLKKDRVRQVFFYGIRFFSHGVYEEYPKLLHYCMSIKNVLGFLEVRLCATVARVWKRLAECKVRLRRLYFLQVAAKAGAVQGSTVIC